MAVNCPSNPNPPNHCWHAASAQPMIPNQFDAICCFCGEVRVVQLTQSPGHGSHAILWESPEAYRVAYQEFLDG